MDNKLNTLIPIDDPHLHEAIQDFTSLFTSLELQKESFLMDYISEELARYGRWSLRGRAPALCFEAACAGALKYLENRGQIQTECTLRVDSALAKTLAGMIVSTVEPNAPNHGPIREKAILIVADEFLARASSPKVSLPARRRMRKRRTTLSFMEDSPLFNENEPPPLSALSRMDEQESPYNLYTNNNYNLKEKDKGEIYYRRPSDLSDIYSKIPHSLNASPSPPLQESDTHIEQEEQVPILFGSSSTKRQKSIPNDILSYESPNLSTLARKESLAMQSETRSEARRPSKSITSLLDSVLSECESYLEDLDVNK